MSRLVTVFLALCFSTLPNACADTSEPLSPSTGANTSSASISAASPVKLTATVGTDVQSPPSVLVMDSKGMPLAGAHVNFYITDGTGSLSNSTAVTNSSGVANVAAWRIGKSSGLNVVNASIPSAEPIRFEVIGLAGPAAEIIKVAGDDQVAARGAPVPVKPQMRVIDSYNNAVKGISVSFAIEAGGGSLAGENATSDSLGVATLASWTLGASGGQILVAAVTELTPVKFRATTFDLPEACTPVDLLAEQAPLASELRAQACERADGRFVDYYVVRMSGANAWKFKVVSAAFDTQLELLDQSGVPVARNRASSVTTNSEIWAMLPPGNFFLVVTSAAPGAVGRYEVSYASGSSTLGGCEVSIVRGISTAQTFSGGECPQIGGLYLDRYRIYLRARSTVSIVLDDYSLSDNQMHIEDDNGNVLAHAVIKDYVQSTLDYTADVDGYYVISIWVAERYELTVR